MSFLQEPDLPGYTAKGNTMKRTDKPEIDDELREEYDVSKMKGVVRGKYAERYKQGSNIVVLAPDVAEAFPDEESVNEALRLLISVAKSASRKAS